MNNEVTLAICVYNDERYIKETLESVTNQTFQKFDLLIIDDASTDCSISIAKDILEKANKGYRLISLAKNRGIAYARETALRSAVTQYLIFIDSDDLAHPELLEKQYNIIKSDRDIIGVDCWLQFIDQRGRKIKGGLFIGAKTKQEYLSRAKQQKMVFLPIQCLFEREAALSVGGFRLDKFPEGDIRYQDFCEDLDLWTRMSDLYEMGKYMITIPEVLYSYRKTGLGLSSNRLNMILKMKFVKTNLKRRRAGGTELSFVDFLDNITPKEQSKLERDATIATLVSNGIFLCQRGRIVRGGYYIIKSICMNPRYFWQKLKANSGLFR
ncbi:MAG: glycosyltransferase family 2 protein [Rikenellaceae bacterium]